MKCSIEILRFSAGVVHGISCTIRTGSDFYLRGIAIFSKSEARHMGTYDIPSTLHPPFEPPEQDRAEAWGVKAIETHYRGYHYRSRLEARWSVFFDSLGIRFVYEPEGFILAGNIWYLPDFLLTQVEMWAEVKPRAFTETEAEKCRLLAAGTHRPCLMLTGLPDMTVYPAYAHDCGETQAVNYLLDIDYHGRKFYDKQKRLFAPSEYWSPSEFTERYQEAVNAARAARFDRRVA